MHSPHIAAELRIKELEAQLKVKNKECMETRKARYLLLQQERFQGRLVAAAAKSKGRSGNMDIWSCDELARWFQEIGLANYCDTILSEGVDGAFLLGLPEDGWTDMGIEVWHVPVLRASLLPFLARFARRTECLASGDYKGILADRDPELDATFMKSELGVEKLQLGAVEMCPGVVAAGVDGDINTRQVLFSITLILEAGGSGTTGEGQDVAAYSFLFEDELEGIEMNEGEALRNLEGDRGSGGDDRSCCDVRAAMSWQVSARCCDKESNRAPDQSHQRNCNAAHWAVLHEVEDWMFARKHGGAYFSITQKLSDINECSSRYDMVKVEFFSTMSESYIERGEAGQGEHQSQDHIVRELAAGCTVNLYGGAGRCSYSP